MHLSYLNIPPALQRRDWSEIKLKIAWLAGLLAELNNRLLQYRKIWKIKIKVLNEELAKEMGLICNYK